MTESPSPLTMLFSRHTKRREFIAGLGSAAAWPVVAQAQQAAVPVIGFLSTQSADDQYKHATIPFLQGLKETGYVEGQNAIIEYRYAKNQFDLLPTLIISAAARNNVPAVYIASQFARDGGLLSYGPDGVDTWRRAATYVDRILRGESRAICRCSFR